MNEMMPKFQLVSLPERFFGGREMPEVVVVDLKGKKWQVVSESLKERMEAVLERGEQVMIFLNRRGSAGAVQCLDCGAVQKCPECEVPFALHGFGERARLICHHCCKVEMPKLKCEECGGVRIWAVGSGTEKVESEIQKLFPSAKVARMDHDTVTKKGAHEEIFLKMKNGEIDVLVGTQMIAKGWDLPKVSLVGVILADVGLHRPEFGAPEKIFQLVTQVAGRAGRREERGEVVVQTLSPENAAIRFGARHDFLGFFKEEIERRKEGGWPPFEKVVRLEKRGMDKNEVAREAENVARKLRVEKGLEVLGPAPCLPPKVAGKYRWQVLVKGEGGREAVAGLDLKGWRVIVEG